MSGVKYLEDTWKTHPISMRASSSDTDVRVQAEQSTSVSHTLASLNFVVVCTLSVRLRGLQQ